MMRRLLCAVVLVGLFSVFMASADAATFALPDKLTLYENYEGECVPYYFRIKPMQGQVYQVSGYLQWPDGKEVFSGTAVKEGAKARIAITMPTAMDGLKPWVAEFLLNVNTKKAEGTWQSTDGTGEGDLILYPECPLTVQGASQATGTATVHRGRR